MLGPRMAGPKSRQQATPDYLRWGAAVLETPRPAERLAQGGPRDPDTQTRPDQATWGRPRSGCVHLQAPELTGRPRVRMRDWERRKIAGKLDVHA